ncbi:hypothetical protein PsYK624_052830 [Phanerochaete sordida]|uniref:Uncharacterized protein n=1 Tax=Phanerochaete sordida TaxID=48140 RepID=A0A9P3LCH3_9APHY|nr:hypothetical protein PsYK624_052830 [Phanerochaete sordida]
MKFFAAVLPLFAIASASVAAQKPPKSPYMGTIAAPARSTVISQGVPFAFQYNVSNWCNEAYNRFRVFATEGDPSYDDVTSDGYLPYAIYDFGEYFVANYGQCSRERVRFSAYAVREGLPQVGIPPPSSLTLPDIGYTGPGHLSVVQIFTDCPVSDLI